MSDVVELQVNGRKFSGWESLTITRAMDSVASAFSLSAPWNPDVAEIAEAFRPFGYQSAKILIDGELILTGRIEQVSASTQEADRVINVQGRSLTGSLVDGAVDIGTYQFEGLTLSGIAKQITQPFGISVIAESDTESIEEVRCEPGQKAFDFLNGIAKGYGLILTTDPQGRLVITKANRSQSPVAALVEGIGLVMEVSGEYDGAGRYSVYKVYSQQDGETADAESADSGVGIYRPRIDTGAEGDAEKIGDAAEWARSLALASAVNISVKISGWRDAQKGIWDSGKIITIKAPGAFIMNESTFLIAEAVLTLDASAGRTTTLRPVLPATYTGEMPEVYPWA